MPITRVLNERMFDTIKIGRTIKETKIRKYNIFENCCHHNHHLFPCL